METRDFSKKWPKIKDILLKRYPQLTSEQLNYQIGKEEELLKRLQKKLGKNKDELDNLLALMG